MPTTNVIAVAKDAVFIDITNGDQSIFTNIPPFLLLNVIFFIAHRKLYSFQNCG
jgi:hypothetical protein